jgi:hypothetical protein
MIVLKTTCVRSQCRRSKIKTFIDKEVYCTPSVKNSTIVLFSNKSLYQHFFNKDGNDPIELLKGEQLNKVMDNFMPLCFPNICNFIALFKHCPINNRYIDNIILLKSKSCYNSIQDNYFFGQFSNQNVR